MAAIPDRGLRREVARLVGDAPLAPVHETRIRRTTWTLAPPSGLVEMALDEGEIAAGDRAAPFREAEFELKGGAPRAVFEAALAVVSGPVRFSTMSKAARGARLAAAGSIGVEPAVRNAAATPLERGQTAEAAAQAMLRECFRQAAANVEATVALDDPEGPHQLRVALRRLRAMLSAFEPAIGGAAALALAEEAKTVAREVGRLRDADVALDEIVAAGAAAWPDEPGFARLGAALEARRATVRSQVRAALSGPEAARFQLDFAAFVETRGWLEATDVDQTGRLAQPVEALAKAALAKRWRKVSRRFRDVEAMDHEARHALRKELKKLRYLSDFFAPLFPDARVAAFRKKLRKLQDVFGALNDFAMAHHLLTGPEAPAPDDPAAQRAVGLVLGARAERAERDWSKARALWRALAAQGPFWK